MDKLDECIKLFNISLTNSLEREDFFRIDYDPERIDINYSDCISLYDLVSSFNKLHLSFKREYSELPKLDLGKEITVNDFTKIDDELRVLDMSVYKPKAFNENYLYLYLREINGVSMPYITNDQGSIHSDNFYKSNVKIPSQTVKQYLDLFEKYQVLFELYKHLKNKIIFNSGPYFLNTRINSIDNNFLDDMDCFKISLNANYYMKPSDHIDISVNLGNIFGIDAEESNIILGDDDIEPTVELCTDILKRIYIHNKYLGKEKNNNKENVIDKVKVLKTFNN